MITTTNGEINHLAREAELHAQHLHNEALAHEARHRAALEAHHAHLLAQTAHHK